MKISAAIITFNEERNIERCILSLSDLADEIVVVDSFSKDRTKEICLKHGVKFIEHAFPGHIEQKNYAIQQCSHDYVLSLDADEALSDELKASLFKIKNSSNPKKAYRFNRKTNYCGKWVNYSGWYPDVKIRLFHKDAGAWGGRNPHDSYLVKDSKDLEWLKGDLLHYSYYSVEEHLKQAQKFANIAAQAMYERGEKSNQFLVWIKPIAKFIRNYILKLGFLDGAVGWKICTISAKATYWRYAQLLTLQKS